MKVFLRVARANNRKTYMHALTKLEETDVEIDYKRVLRYRRVVSYILHVSRYFLWNKISLFPSALFSHFFLRR